MFEPYWVWVPAAMIIVLGLWGWTVYWYGRGWEAGEARLKEFELAWAKAEIDCGKLTLKYTGLLVDASRLRTELDEMTEAYSNNAMENAALKLELAKLRKG